MTGQKMEEIKDLQAKVGQRNRQIKYLKGYQTFLVDRSEEKDDRIKKLERQLARRSKVSA